MKVVNEKDSPCVVMDYWKFTKELRSQIDLIRVLGRQFFEIDDLCDWSVRNDVTVLDPKHGKRVSLVDNSLGRQQAEIYENLRIEVGNLYDMLSMGRSCFEQITE